MQRGKHVCMKEDRHWTVHYGRKTFKYSKKSCGKGKERNWVAMNIGTMVTNKERMHGYIM
jgi:hypothetical protein